MGRRYHVYQHVRRWLVLSFNDYGSLFKRIIGYHFDQQMTTEIVEKTLDEAKVEISSYVQGFYNNRKIHSALAYVSPSQFEQTILAA